MRAEYREPRSIERPGPARGSTHTSRLRSGETLFFAGRKQTSFGNLYPMAAARSLRVVTRRAVMDGARGILVWLEPEK